MNSDYNNTDGTITPANENVERFNHLWEDFRNTFKGELLSIASSSEGLTSTAAVNALREAKQTWGVPETMCGRWVKTLVEKYPEQGDRVSRILTEDLSIEPMEHPADSKETAIGAGVAGGAVGAAAGYFLPRVLGASTLLSATGGLIGAAAVALGAVHTVNSRKASPEQTLIEGYLTQLEHYHDRVVEVLESASRS
ncbi:MAG: hypothetical protein K2O24_00265 [Muribaculaceae bacterium]|nr:hypothetical protein [Muribaculaceae bacterium]